MQRKQQVDSRLLGDATFESQRKAFPFSLMQGALKHRLGRAPVGVAVEKSDAVPDFVTGNFRSTMWPPRSVIDSGPARRATSR